MKWLLLLLCTCTYQTNQGAFSWEEKLDVDLLTEERCIVMMWDDRLDKKTVRAVSLKELDGGKYRVLPTVGDAQKCDSYYILEDTTLCK